MATISAAVKKMQQELSEKYGIPTFDLKGKISTIPTTRPATGINVGTGIYGTSVDDFNNFIKSITPQKATVPTSPIVLSGGQVIDVPVTSKLVEGETPLTSREIPKSLSSSIGDAFTQYSPYIILGGIALLAITLLKK